MVSDIHKAKPKLTEFSFTYRVEEGCGGGKKTSGVKARKRMRVAKDADLEKAVLK